MVKFKTNTISASYGSDDFPPDMVCTVGTLFSFCKELLSEVRV